MASMAPSNMGMKVVVRCKQLAEFIADCLLISDIGRIINTRYLDTLYMNQNASPVISQL